MKIAISIPDKLFIAADAHAAQAGVSRSELYATAMTEYLARREETRITERLNAVYAAQQTPITPELPVPDRPAASRLDHW